MNIAIIGAGPIGGTIAQKLSPNHHIYIANSKGVDAVRPFADTIGATACDVDGIFGLNHLDVLILSVPFKVYGEWSQALWERLNERTVIVDTSNYYPEFRDTPIAEIDNGTPESVWLSERIGRPVVKAFNMVLAHSLIHFGKPKGDSDRLAMWVAGDDENAKRTVMSLVDECGFEPVDNGDLAHSWTQQAGAAGYCCDYTADKLTQIQQASGQTKSSVRQNRAYVMTNFEALTGDDSGHDSIIKMNRKHNR